MTNCGFRFRQALAGPGLAVTAEIKRRSPSAGELDPNLDAAELAVKYRQGGAACLSVLTESARFGGSTADLKAARLASGLPTLRKDFLTTPADIEASKEMGADALLLIVADIDPAQLRPLHRLAFDLKLDVLTEVRNRAELAAATAAGANMIAVNQRSDPKSSQLTVDYGRALEMARFFDRLDPAPVRVAASGIGVEGGTPVAALAEAGYDAVLVGEALVLAPDPAKRLRQLLGGS